MVALNSLLRDTSLFSADQDQRAGTTYQGLMCTLGESQKVTQTKFEPRKEGTPL